MGDHVGSDKKNGRISTRFVEDDPSSEEAFSRARSWINTCTSSHEYCKSNLDVPLPTRVLNVEEANVTGMVKLVETGGRSSKYIALSHCWGDVSTENEDGM